MGALPRQGKGELYGAEITFMRTWFPPQAQGLLECLSNDQVRTVINRGKELSSRGPCFFPDPESLRVALIELFAWGSIIERLDYAIELVHKRSDTLPSIEESFHEEYLRFHNKIYGQPRW